MNIFTGCLALEDERNVERFFKEKILPSLPDDSMKWEQIPWKEKRSIRRLYLTRKHGGVSNISIIGGDGPKGY